MAGLSTFNIMKRATPPEGARMLSGTELAELQRVLAGMLRDIEGACRKAGVRCMLAYGSCLGAVRHGGFIPWDDDLDLAMTRGDYERFAGVFEELLGEAYVLQSPETTAGYDLGFSRIRKKGTLLRSRDDLFAEGECGIYIDLFVLESVPDSPVLRLVHGIGSLGLGFAYSCRRFAKYGKHYLRFVEDDVAARRVFKFKIAVGRVLSFASVEAWTRAWSRWNALCAGEDSGFLSIPAASRHYFGEIKPRSVLLPYAPAAFGGVETHVPRDCDAYLTALYGADYMVEPPESEREKHVVFAFALCL